MPRRIYARRVAVWYTNGTGFGSRYDLIWRRAAGSELLDILPTCNVNYFDPVYIEVYGGHSV